MKTQNYQNHRRLVPAFHIVQSAIILTLTIFAFINLYRVCMAHESRLVAGMLILISFSMLIGWICMRTFPIKAQDRAIRAEENLRHFVLTGKLLDKNLKIGQIIALRFAPDEEFVGLAERAVTQNLGVNDIKKAIKNWKEDNHRA
jgi:hypothetical protein